MVTKAGLTVPLHNFKITIQNQRFEKKKKKKKSKQYIFYRQNVALKQVMQCIQAKQKVTFIKNLSY